MRQRERHEVPSRQADSIEQVHAFYRAGLNAGGKDNGEPGYRTRMATISKLCVMLALNDPAPQWLSQEKVAVHNMQVNTSDQHEPG
jgi:hypothetical protein